MSEPSVYDLEKFGFRVPSNVGYNVENEKYNCVINFWSDGYPTIMFRNISNIPDTYHTWLATITINDEASKEYIMNMNRMKYDEVSKSLLYDPTYRDELFTLDKFLEFLKNEDELFNLILCYDISNLLNFMKDYDIIDLLETSRKFRIDDDYRITYMKDLL